VRFLNTRTVDTVEFLAIELAYSASEGVEVLVPVTYGEEGAGDKSDRAGHWSERDLLEAVETSCSPDGLKAAERLLNFARAHDGRPYPGKRTSAQPSMTFWFGEEPGPGLSFSIYAAPAGKTNIAINFDWMRRYTNEATLSRLAQRLREISGVAGKLADLERSEFRRRPGLLIDQVFASPPAVSALEAALLEVLEHGEALESPFLD
jgi:hypothetical protein